MATTGSGPDAAQRHDAARLISHCVAALDLADADASRLDPGTVLQVPGMCGRRTRHLYNNLCNLEGGCRLLEVGCHRGAATVAALRGNESTAATVVDDFSEFGGPKDDFLRNVRDAGLEDRVTLEDVDCWEFFARPPSGAPYDVYVYDAGHTLEDQRRAIVEAAPHLASPCVVVIDDWNWGQVREGTARGLEDAGAEVLWRHEIATGWNGDLEGYWNGAGLFVLRFPGRRGA